MLEKVAMKLVDGTYSDTKKDAKRNLVMAYKSLELGKKILCLCHDDLNVPCLMRTLMYCEYMQYHKPQVENQN